MPPKSQKLKFIFDLDGTLTCVETLPLIAAHFGLSKEIEQLTQMAVSGQMPFEESFAKRVEILGEQSVDEINTLLAETPLFLRMLGFIQQNKADCVIATSNLDVWTDKLAHRIGCEFQCSTAQVRNDRVTGISRVLDKKKLVAELRNQSVFTVFIGDGENDLSAMQEADLSIAIGLVHAPAHSILKVADFTTYDEDQLIERLNEIRRD